MSNAPDRRNAPAAQYKPNRYDDQECPRWGIGPDGRATMIDGDERLPALFRAWQEDACRHPETITLERTDSANRTFYSLYCVHCGTQLRSHLPFNEVHRCGEMSRDEIDGILDRYHEARKARLDAITTAAAERCQAVNRQNHDDYFRTEAWQRRRAKIIQHAGGMCQGCLTNPAEEVHHLSYEHFGAEFAWELRAICAACHRRLHGR